MSTRDPRGSEEPRVQEFGRGGRISGGPEPDLSEGPRNPRANVTLAIAIAAVVIVVGLLIFAIAK